MAFILMAVAAYFVWTNLFGASATERKAAYVKPLDSQVPAGVTLDEAEALGLDDDPAVVKARAFEKKDGHTTALWLWALAVGSACCGLTLFSAAFAVLALCFHAR